MNLTQSAMLTFSGWEDVSPQDNVQAVFHFIPEDDQKFAYEQFFRKLGKYRFKYQKRLTSKRKKRKNPKNNQPNDFKRVQWVQIAPNSLSLPYNPNPS